MHMPLPNVGGNIIVCKFFLRCRLRGGLMGDLGGLAWTLPVVPMFWMVYVDHPLSHLLWHVGDADVGTGYQPGILTVTWGVGWWAVTVSVDCPSALHCPSAFTLMLWIETCWRDVPGQAGSWSGVWGRTVS